MVEFIDKIKNFSKRIDLIKDNLKSEEATKTALVLPFIQGILGYDIFDPLEVVPELTADVGIKRGEKVDYAILKDNNPIVIIEVKPIYEELSIQHINQLYRYYTSVKEVKFAILTNGVVYKFFTDLENKNIMDQEPFLEINLSDLNEEYIKELYYFKKNTFNELDIINNYKNRIYKTIILNKIQSELSNPSDEFIKLLVKDSNFGIKNSEIKKLRDLTMECINEVLNKSDIANEIEEVKEVEKNITNTNILTLNDEITYYKPNKIIIEGVAIEVYSWRSLLIEVCNYLGKIDPKKFSKLEYDVRGKKRKLISKNKLELREPLYLRELDIYVEGNLSANSIVYLSKRMLKYYGKDIDSIKIELEI